MTRKHLSNILITMAVTGLGLTACNDGLNGNGSLLVKVNYGTFKVSQAKVYLNRDSTYHPDSLNDEFDKQQRADAIGEASFNNLEPGKYFIYAEGLEPGRKIWVWGIDSIMIRKRHRQNTYNLAISTNAK